MKVQGTVCVQSWRLVQRCSRYVSLDASSLSTGRRRSLSVTYIRLYRPSAFTTYRTYCSMYYPSQPVPFSVQPTPNSYTTSCSLYPQSAACCPLTSKCKVSALNVSNCLRKSPMNTGFKLIDL